MIFHHNQQTFHLEAEHDGDFWYVNVFETTNDQKRLRFEYKLNTPGDKTSACARAWEIFAARNLNS